MRPGCQGELIVWGDRNVVNDYTFAKAHVIIYLNRVKFAAYKL